MSDLGRMMGRLQAVRAGMRPPCAAARLSSGRTGGAKVDFGGAPADPDSSGHAGAAAPGAAGGGAGRTDPCVGSAHIP